MSEEELQLLITMDDPEFGPEEDTFHHQQASNTPEYPHDQHCQSDERSAADIERSR
jgi:hypothetical protein